MLYKELPYINTPEYCFAINPKVGCTTVTYHIYKHYHDKNHLKPVNASHYINRLDHTLVPFKPVILLVRHPVDRFLSAINQVGMLDVEECIQSIIGHTPPSSSRYPNLSHQSLRYDAHFRCQYDRAFGETYLFRFPDHLEEALNKLGITEKPRRLNVSTGYKNITSIQQDLILEFYQKDLALYNSIDTAGCMIDTRVETPRC